MARAGLTAFSGGACSACTPGMHKDGSPFPTQ
jgi:hypothetical protein